MSTPATYKAFEWAMRVYWEDTDAGGIVFYANYLKFFERSRTEWLRSLDVGQQVLRQSTGCMFVVSAASISYRRPARLDDELAVTTRLHEAARASLTLEQQVFLKPSPGAPSPASGALCHGTIRIGWVDAATLQPRRIPSFIIDRLKIV